jgi:diguanylate cyclase (GGDEF)-like protein
MSNETLLVMNKAKLSILIVDGDEDDLLAAQRLLRESLKGIALELGTASSHAQALRQIESAYYDLVLLGCQLGQKNGLDVIRDVRAKGIDTPMILLIGPADEAIAVADMKNGNGPCEYLPKAKLNETLLRTTIRYSIELHEKEELCREMAEALRRTSHDVERQLKELECRSRQSSLLSELGNALQACVTTSEAHSLIARFLSEFFPGRSGALCMFDPGRTAIQAVAVWGEKPPSQIEFASDECWALRRGRPHLAACGSPGNAACRHLNNSRWATHFCAPLAAHGETIGVLALQGDEPNTSAQGQGLFASETQRHFADTIAEHIALGLANLKLREALREQALHDSLTGLFNRRYMQEFLDKAVSSAHRHARPLTVLILDLDRFKEFNDCYGHEHGDTVLQFVGEFLQLHSRKEDMACRYGGDEFVLAFPELPLSVGATRAEYLRAAIKQARSSNDSAQCSVPTLSIGVAAVPQHGFSAQGLLRAADAALYRAKAQDGDRVVTAELANVGEVGCTSH